MSGELSDRARAIAAHRPEAPFDLLGIDHVVLVVDDMARALDFYCGALGCVPGFSYPDLAMEQVWCGNALIVLIDASDPKSGRVPPSPETPNMDHVAIAVGPFEAAALKAHLKARGVAIEREARHGGARGMGAALYVRDPAGNLVEIKGPPTL